MADPMIDKNDEQLLQDAEGALKEIFDALDTGSWSLDHHEDCPQDEGCSCPAGAAARIASDALNAISYRLRWRVGNRIALRGVRNSEAHKVKKLEGNQVVTECGLVHHHEAYYEITQTRAGVVLHLGNIAGCPVCYPEEVV